MPFNIGLEGNLNNMYTYTSSNANYSAFTISGLCVENTPFVATLVAADWLNCSNEQHSISRFFKSDFVARYNGLCTSGDDFCGGYFGDFAQ